MAVEKIQTALRRAGGRQKPAPIETPILSSLSPPTRSLYAPKMHIFLQMTDALLDAKLQATPTPPSQLGGQKSNFDVTVFLAGWQFGCIFPRLPVLRTCFRPK